jgi:hypothetical protein
MPENLFGDRRRHCKGGEAGAGDASQKLYQAHSRIDNPLQTFP